jgi:hypothetical protein
MDRQHIEAGDLQLEIRKVLVEIRALYISFGTRHLQCDEALLRALFDDVNTCLEPVAAALNLLAKVLNHLLELIDQSTDGRITGLRGSRTVRAVEWIGFHGLRSLIPDC